MKTDSLPTYINDHLAGAAAAIDLLEKLHEDHPGEAIGQLAATLRTEILADREKLQMLSDRVGSAPSKLKQAAARVTAKAAQVKLGRHLAGDFGVFQALEVLSLGILGKRALWRALSALARNDSRLAGMDLDELTKRAERQYDLVEAKRLSLVQSALARNKSIAA
jgi:hypothetical protein